MTFGVNTLENVFINGRFGGIGLADNTLHISNSAIALSDPQGKTIAKAGCDPTFMSDEIISGGYNIVADGSCELNGPGDQQNTDPGLMLPGDDSLVPTFAPGSPAIDGGPINVTNGELPCSVTDITGLPRPQDGDGDGSAQCDVGAVELQQGEDIGAAQTGAFFDVDRDGEGIFVEMLGNGQALVYLFSYTPNGNKAFWAVGIGEVTRNGVVIRKEAFVSTQGPTFGEGFDPADVEIIPFADMSISFPDCTNTSNEGVLAIEANSALGFPPLLSRTSRILNVLSCDDASQAGPGFSGSFADASHSGEGIIVQVISPSQALVIWFSYDLAGNQNWFIGVGAIDGDTITVVDAVMQSGPSYGQNYDPTDVVRTIWGTFSVVFANDCNSAVLDYASVVSGYGSGSQNMSRISAIDGLACEI